MPLTCAHWLSVLEPQLVPPLFNSEAVGHFRALSRVLPGECQSVLEVRLAPGGAPIDLSLRLLTASQARGMAERLPPSPGKNFLLLWSEPEGPLDSVPSVWLEFDLDRGLPDFLDPVVCAKLPGRIDPHWLFGALLPALLESSPPARQRDQILSCLRALPPSASLLYLFNLRARGSDAVRLEIFGMGTPQILDYLRRVAPERVPETFKAVSLLEGADRLHLSFDVTDEVLPRIGIEGSFSRQPPREPRWKNLFSKLVAGGLCSPGKRDAALAWPGYDSFWTAPNRWPVAETGTRGFCIRALSHLKVVCLPGQEPEAKAYLTFGPLERSGTGAASSPASRSVSST